MFHNMFYNQKLYNIYYIQQMTQLYKINVKLSKNQKKNIADAYRKRETVVIRLKNDSLNGKDTLNVPATVKKRLEKNRNENKGMEIKLSKTNIRKQIGGSLLTSVLSMARMFGPTIAKTMGLAALAGAASTGASQIVKKIAGKGQTGGFLIPQNKIDETVVIRLKNDSLNGKDTLNVPATVKKRLEKNRNENKGMEIKLSKTNIRKQIGGSLLTSVLSMARMFGPTIAKTMGLAALAGAASTGASQIVKKIAGKGQTGGFLIPQNKIDKLIANKHLLSAKQKKDILDALQSGSGVVIKPTKTQSGGFLGTLLASIGIPLVLKALTGRGLHVEQSRPRRSIPIYVPPKKSGGKNKMMPYQPPPFIGSWGNQIGLGKKKTTKKKKGKGLLLGQNSPFNQIPLLGAIL